MLPLMAYMFAAYAGFRILAEIISCEGGGRNSKLSPAAQWALALFGIAGIGALVWCAVSIAIISKSLEPTWQLLLRSAGQR
jgi:hypothetical protein